ncbi:MAG: GNAT family N-acetyltransferase [Desulfobacteraceae bacterium]|nr:GNAT family N-acetyltransferase [Desulfobacteraceae bacterium]
MKISLKFDSVNIDWDEAVILFERAPLGKRDPEKLRRAFENSFIACFALDDKKLVGAARIISDGEYQAGVCDVVVLPEYQGKGVGKMMMEAMLARINVPTMILFATPGKEGFYQKFGFSRLKTGMAKFSDHNERRARGFIE